MAERGSARALSHARRVLRALHRRRARPGARPVPGRRRSAGDSRSRREVVGGDNQIMARGFESKSVQEQWQDAEAAQDQRKKKKKSKEEIERQKKREGLELSRRGTLHELEEAKNEGR